MSDPQPTESRRPSLETVITLTQLGKTPYQAIEYVLQQDAHAIGDYWSSTVQNSLSNLPPDLIDLYNFSPEQLEHTSGEILDFHAGFNLVVFHWYPEIIDAQLGQQTRDLPSNLSELLSRLSPNAASDIQQELLHDIGEQDRQREYIKESLRIDPSGLKWLKQKIFIEETETGAMSSLERYGIERALAGIQKLYQKVSTTSK